jgi:outer membrane protein assembly factor BamB
VLKDARENQPGLFSYNKNLDSEYFVDMEISDSLKLVWSNDAHGSFLYSSVVFYDDYLFVSDLSGRVYCFVDSTGKEIGAEKYKGEVAVSPLIHGSSILFGVNFFEENYAAIFFYDFIRGDYKNQINIRGSLVNEFIRSENNFAVLTGSGDLIKYDYQGEKVWEYNSGEGTICTPYLGDDRVYFGTENGELICVDYNSGKKVWRTKITDRIESTPVKALGKIIVGDSGGRIICYDESSMSVLWEFETGAEIKSQPLVIDDNVLAGNLSGSLYSINLDSGEENWNLKLGGVFNSTPLAFRNLLVQPDLNKKVYLIDHRSGKVVNELKFDARVRLSPAFYRNKIYFGVDRGDIYCYRVLPL